MRVRALATSFLRYLLPSPDNRPIFLTINEHILKLFKVEIDKTWLRVNRNIMIFFIVAFVAVHRLIQLTVAVNKVWS